MVDATKRRPHHVYGELRPDFADRGHGDQGVQDAHPLQSVQVHPVRILHVRQTTLRQLLLEDLDLRVLQLLHAQISVRGRHPPSVQLQRRWGKINLGLGLNHVLTQRSDRRGGENFAQTLRRFQIRHPRRGEGHVR